VIDPALLRRDVLTRIGAGVVIVDPRTRVIEWANPTAVALFGAPADQIVGQLCHCFLCPAEKGNCPILDQCKDVENAERVLLRHDGQELAVMKSVKRIRIEGEEKLLETFVDISARKRAEAARRESDDRYRLLFENSRDAMMVLAQPTWNFVSANAATLELFGVKDEATFTALAPWHLSPATQPDGCSSAEKAREMIEMAMREGSHCFEWRHLRLDGHEFSTSVQLTRLEFSGQLLLQATVRDLSPTERTLSALRNSEQRLRLAVEATGMGTYVWDHATGQAYYSSEFLALYDLSPDGSLALGADLTPLAILDEDRPVFQAAMAAGNDPHGDGIMKAEYRVRRPDGSVRWLMARGRTEFEGTRPSRSAGIIMDISERKRADELAAWEMAQRKRAEDALRENEEQLDKIFNSSTNGMAFTEPTTGEILNVNDAWVRDTGIVRSEAIGKTALGLGLWPKKSDRDAAMVGLEGEGRLREFAATLVSRGVERQFAINAESVDIRGERFHLWEFRDITERTCMENELRESEARFRTLFQDSPLAIALTRGVETLYVNKMFLQVFALASAESLVRHSIMACVAPESREEILGRARQRALGNPLKPEYEIVGLRADGVKFPIRVVVAIVQLPEGQATLFFITDLSERRRAEEEIALLKHSIDVHYDAAYWTDSNGKFIYVNEAGAKVLGFESGELIGKALEDVNPRATAERMKVVWDKLRKDGFHRSESVHQRKDGSEIPVEILTSYIQFGGKEYACGFARDMTEQKHAEEETARLTGQLQQAQKMESVGRLAGGVAHDFNNMLGVILGHCELALEKVDPSSSLHGDLVNIQTAAQRSADLTRQLLAFARKQTVAPKVLHLNDTVAGMLKMVKRLIGEDVKLDWRPGENLGPLKIDPTQIDQILANLCVNARDAIADVGTITITTGTKVVSADDPTLSAGATPGDYVWLAVGDDGCGMDPITQTHVFEPFFTTKEVGKGTGLGLATVYGIVKQNNGFIDLRSEFGQGTVITIYLPRHVGKAGQERIDAAVAGAQPGQETILLVEDEAPLLAVTQRMLEKHGYKVVSASTPGHAIQLAREHAGNIDLLITDVVMPEMNGRDLAKNILALYPQTKRLFMSGYTADVIAHQGVLDEGVFFIQKPFSARDLAATVRKVLDFELAVMG
jgi:PAS domain S-box-containing protein